MENIGRLGVSGGGGAMNRLLEAGLCMEPVASVVPLGAEDARGVVPYGLAGDGDVAKYMSKSAPSRSL